MPNVIINRAFDVAPGFTGAQVCEGVSGFLIHSAPVDTRENFSDP